MFLNIYKFISLFWILCNELIAHFYHQRNEKAPDFKHKETGEGLWLGSSPSWVLDKLPPVKPKKGVETDRKSTLVS